MNEQCIALAWYYGTVSSELRLECVRFWRERRKLFVIARSTVDPTSAKCYVCLFLGYLSFNPLSPVMQIPSCQVFLLVTD